MPSGKLPLRLYFSKGAFVLLLAPPCGLAAEGQVALRYEIDPDVIALLTHVWTVKIPLSSKVNGMGISMLVCIEGQTAEQTLVALLHVEFAEDVK